MRVKRLVWRNYIPTLHIYEEQEVKLYEYNIKKLLFVILPLIHIFYVTMDTDHVRIGIWKETMYPSLSQNN